MKLNLLQVIDQYHKMSDSGNALIEEGGKKKINESFWERKVEAGARRFV